MLRELGNHFKLEGLKGMACRAEGTTGMSKGLRWQEEPYGRELAESSLFIPAVLGMLVINTFIS